LSTSPSNRAEDAGQEFFSEFLARARLERGLPWDELAGMLGITTSTLSDYMRGERLPRTRPGSSRAVPSQKLARYAEALDYPLEYVTACWQHSLNGRGTPRMAVCQRGHKMTPENTGTQPCGIFCRQCAEDRMQAKRPGYERAHQEHCAAVTCVACGTPGVYRLRARLCERCYRSQRKYGDPLGSLRQSRSGYRGIRPNNSTKRPWTAEIMHNGVTHRLGCFATSQDAARAYDAKARELRGPRARLNFPR
jgi:hypothetical protein